MRFNKLEPETIMNKSIPEPNSGCWIWTGCYYGSGYGSMSILGVKRNASRASFICFNKEYANLPRNIFVMHKCDNRACVNPQHLKLGTPADNQRDMVNKGRSNRGSKRPFAKLTEEQVLKIRELLSSKKESISTLAKNFSVSYSTILEIKKGHTWKHVPFPTEGNERCQQP